MTKVKRIIKIITQTRVFPRSFVLRVQHNPNSNPSEETIHRTSRWQFVMLERGRWRSLTRGLYCRVSYMVRNSLNEFTPCFFSAVLLRAGRGGRVEDPLLLFLSPTRYIRNPALFLECLLIRHTLTSRRAISVKRQFIFPALYTRCMGQKYAWPAKGNVWGVA